jgi:hypothetical protein
MKGIGFNLTVKVEISDFLGFKIEHKYDGTIHLTLPQVIYGILKELHLDRPYTKCKDTPAASNKILGRHPKSPSFDNHFHYRRAIGKLHYLEKSTRPDFAHAVNQCERFLSDPKAEHANALKWLGRYLHGTRDKGIIMCPTGDLFDVYVDADFAGNWIPQEAMDDDNTARSRYGYILMYNGCLVTWASRMQTEVASSTTESEYIGLSQSLRQVILLINLAKEFKERGLLLFSNPPKIHCKLFEDNCGAIKISNVPKMRPRTKHINVKYHHYRDYVETEDISINKIDTADQPADMLTKPVNKPILAKY